MLKSGFEKKNSLKQKGNKKPISTRVNILHLSLGHETEISILKKNITIQTTNQWDIDEWKLKKK
jgi:hypothetical protein